MANETKTRARGKQVSGTVSPEVAAWLDEHHWDRRMTLPQLVGTVLTEYAQANGFQPPADEGEESHEA